MQTSANEPPVTVQTSPARTYKQRLKNLTEQHCPSSNEFGLDEHLRTRKPLRSSKTLE
jgi:hypothetical protein